MTIEEYVKKAIRENKSITIKYKKYDGTITTRRISDIEESDEFGAGYIRAYCHLRGEERTFKISRILEVDGIKANSSSSAPLHTYSPPPRYTPTPKPTPRYTPSSYSYSQPKRQSEGCYIATMAYGDYDHPQVMTLRRYRDQVLASSFLGRKFIEIYYFVSPKLVAILQGHKRTNSMIRKVLDAFVALLRKCYNIL